MKPAKNVIHGALFVLCATLIAGPTTIVVCDTFFRKIVAATWAMHPARSGYHHEEVDIEPRRLDQRVSLASPGNRVVFDFDLSEQLAPSFAVRGWNQPLIYPSVMHLMSADVPTMRSEDWAQNLRVTFVKRSSRHDIWRNAWGERTEVPDNFNEAVIGLSSGYIDQFGSSVSDVVLHLHVRAYDEGVAFRFELPDGAVPPPQLLLEHIEFNLPAATHAYWTRAAQKPYERKRLADWPHPCEPPLTLELANGKWLSLLEAAQVNFPRMRYALGNNDDSVVTRLQEPARIDATPFLMPWRVIMVADTPGQLLEHNYLVLNLNPPNALQDTSWIKPGRVMRAMSFYNEAFVKQVEFALGHNLTYIHLDAGWYGDEYDPTSDATTWNTSRIDLPAMIGYAKSNGLGVILYVNHLALERQIDTIFPLYQMWGVAGVKFGFVNVGPQNWTIWLHDAIRKAAEHRLVVDVHDDYRPTGFSRTYPHLLQVEGILGDEGFPSANQSTIYPFTRFVAGHADHTYCFLDPRLNKTKAHQLALPVVNFGPLQYLFWYDSPKLYSAAESKEVEFWTDLPTVWDESKVLEGLPGHYVVVARRSGASWWVGMITSESPRVMRLSLGFLARGGLGREGGSPGQTYDVRIHEDVGTNTIGKRAAVVTPEDELVFSLRGSGGVALRLRPQDTI